MAPTKKKTVFNAEPGQLEEIQAVVSTGRFRSASELLREAIDEKLERLRRERLEAQVESFVAEPTEAWDDGLVDLQAIDSEDS
jgi:Arc/MetJ-type ribon-helix-helix transcriptional regulator